MSQSAGGFNPYRSEEENVATYTPQWALEPKIADEIKQETEEFRRRARSFARKKRSESGAYLRTLYDIVKHVPSEHACHLDVPQERRVLSELLDDHKVATSTAARLNRATLIGRGVEATPETIAAVEEWHRLDKERQRIWTAYEAAQEAVRRHTRDVMRPAFLAAYLAAKATPMHQSRKRKRKNAS